MPAVTGYFGVAPEAVQGTAVAPTHFIPVMTMNFTADQEEIDYKEVRGTRQNRRTFPGAVAPDASVTTAFYPVGGVGVLLRALFGGSTFTAGAGADPVLPAGTGRHTFVDAARLPTLSIERSDTFAGEGGLLTERLRGAKVESMGLTAAFGEMVDLDFALQGTDLPDLPTARTRAQVAFPTVQPFTFVGVSVEVDGVDNPYFKTIDLSIENELERQNTLRKARTARFINEGALDVTFSATMEFSTRDMYDRFRSFSQFPVRIHLESESVITGAVKYQCIITLPSVKVLTTEVPMEAEGVTEQSIDFSVLNTTGSMINVELINADPAGAYAP